MKKTTLLIVFQIGIVLNILAQDITSIRDSAEQGDAAAQYRLGFMYYDGEEVLADKKEAFYWHKKSAEQDDAAAQLILGMMYLKGHGILMDKKLASYWVRKSYENGNEDAKKIWEENELWKY